MNEVYPATRSVNDLSTSASVLRTTDSGSISYSSCQLLQKDFDLKNFFFFT